VANWSHGRGSMVGIYGGIRTNRQLRIVIGWGRS
jgi:hypothetical protein